MGKRLLLADDSVTIQKVVEITFADKDYELDLASNGDEALQAVQNRRPDLILADVFMPGLDGYQLCERLKSMPEMAGIPVLLLAGTFEPFDEGRAGQVGAAGWIAKPFTSQDLVDKVEQSLAETAEQEQPWQAAPSKSPADSMLNAFEEVAATDFGSGRTDDVQPEDVETTPVPEPAPEAAQPAEVDPFAAPEAQPEPSSDFATGGREDFSFEDLAAADSSQDTPPSSPPAEEPHTAEVAPEPAVPAADFSFTPPEAEEGEASTHEQESYADPFAAAEENLEATPTETEAELPSLDEFSTPDTAVETTPAAAAAPGDTPAAPETDIIDLREDDIVAEGKYAATGARVEARAAYLSDEELERIVERVAGSVIERLASPVLEKVVWEVVPDLAESMIREEMDNIKQSADSGS